MNIITRNSIIFTIISISFLSSCVQEIKINPTVTPTTTPSPTNTSTTIPTFTPTQTITFIPSVNPMPTNTYTKYITQNCIAASGKWESNETSENFGIPGPILTFYISNCQITSWEIWVYPLPGELLWWNGTTTIPITDDKFTHFEESDYGTFSFTGKFMSAKSSRGILNFPEGFNVIDVILTQNVSIPWTASLSK